MSCSQDTTHNTTPGTCLSTFHKTTASFPGTKLALILHASPELTTWLSISPGSSSDSRSTENGFWVLSQVSQGWYITSTAWDTWERTHVEPRLRKAAHLDTQRKLQNEWSQSRLKIYWGSDRWWWGHKGRIMRMVMTSFPCARNVPGAVHTSLIILTTILNITAMSQVRKPWFREAACPHSVMGRGLTPAVCLESTQLCWRGETEVWQNGKHLPHVKVQPLISSSYWNARPVVPNCLAFQESQMSRFLCELSHLLSIRK